MTAFGNSFVWVIGTGCQMWLDLIVSWAFGGALPHSPHPAPPSPPTPPSPRPWLPQISQSGTARARVERRTGQRGSGCHALGILATLTDADNGRLPSVCTSSQLQLATIPNLPHTVCLPQPSCTTSPSNSHLFFFSHEPFESSLSSFSKSQSTLGQERGWDIFGRDGWKKKNGAQALSHLCPPAAEREKERGRVRLKRRGRRREKKGLTGQGQRLRQGCAEATAGSTKKWLSFCFSAPLISELQPAYRLSSIIHEAAGGRSSKEGKEGGGKQKASDSSNQSPSLNDTEWQRVSPFFSSPSSSPFFTTISPFKWDTVLRWKSRVSQPLMARGTQ